MNKNTNRIVLIGIVLVIALAAFAGYVQSLKKAPVAIPGPVAESTQQAPVASTASTPTVTPPPGMPPQGAASQPGTSATDGTGQQQQMKFSVVSPSEYDQGVGPNDGKPLPSELAGLPRSTDAKGVAAVESIVKMHGVTDIQLTGGEVASYEKAGEKIAIWVSESKTVEDAGKLMQSMLKKMEESKDYTPPEALNIKDKIYFQTSGGGMSHYFYLRGNRVYWVGLALQQDKVMDALKFVVNGA